MSDRPLRFDPDAIPPELRAMPGWVATGPDKIPYTPPTGRRADPTRPSTGGTFADAVAAARRDPRFDRIGIILDPATRIIAFDFDGCRDPETGTIGPDDRAEVALLDSYTEASPSGTGVRVLAFGSLPPGRRKKGRREAYDRDRYVSVTGYVLEGRARIEERTAEIAAWHARALGAPTPAAPPVVAVPLELDDRDLLDRCLGNPKFRRLHRDGDTSDYGGDDSAADLAHLNIVVRNGGTPDQADRLYRESAIARPKWDQRRGQGTYGERTIARAFDGSVVPFAPARPAAIVSPERERLAATGTDDATADALPDDVAALKAMIVDLTRRVEVAERRADTAEARTEMLGRVQSTTARIVRNRRLGQERITAVALSYAFANREAAGDAGDGGLYAIPLARIAETAGVSEDSAGKHVKKLTEAGVLRKELRWVPERVDTDTGEILPGRHRQYIGPAEGRVVDFVEAVAALAPSTPKGWGGARTACPDHPNAGTVKRWTLHCAACDRTLDKGEDFRAAEPKPQDAEPPPDDPFAGDAPTPEPRIAAPYPPVDGNYRDRKLRVDHNARPSARIPIIPDGGTTVAAAFQRGRGLPGTPTESPPDRWTG